MCISGYLNIRTECLNLAARAINLGINPFEVHHHSVLRLIKDKQLPPRSLVTNRCLPSVGRRDSGVERGVRVKEPPRVGFVEVRQSADFEFRCRPLVAGDRAFWVSRQQFAHPLHPFGRVEPAVAKLDQPPRGFGDGDRTRVACIAGGGNIGRKAVREGEGLEGGGRSVAGPVRLPRIEVVATKPARVNLASATRLPTLWNQ